MNTFYQVLTPYYDDIFPINEKQINFLSSCFPINSTLLDIGAGTGNSAISLAKHGYNLTVTEIEPSMNVAISDKASDNKLNIAILQNSMQEVSQINKKFDGIYCIGNTLPHLNNLQEISSFLHDVYDLLNPGGIILIQTVNFEKVLHQQGFSFPVIKKEAFTFTRQYALQNEKVMFTTILENSSETHSNTLPLYPVTKSQLENELEHGGFQSITCYGDYGKSPYSIESPALVIMATK